MTRLVTVPIALSDNICEDEFLLSTWKQMRLFSQDFGFSCIQEDDGSCWYYLDSNDGHYTIGLDTFCQSMLKGRVSILLQTLLTHLTSRLSRLVVYFEAESRLRRSFGDQMEEAIDKELGQQGHVRVTQHKNQRGLILAMSGRKPFDQLNVRGGYFDLLEQNGWERKPIWGSQ